MPKKVGRVNTYLFKKNKSKNLLKYHDSNLSKIVFSILYVSICWGVSAYCT